MKFFIDTANVDAIRKAHERGMVDGVTTNPSLVAKEGRDFRQVVDEIASFVKGPISLEVVSEDADGMLKEARDLNSWIDNAAIKIPLTWEGLKATKVCAEEGIKTNVTLCFSANQALLAAKAGATFVSPFIGRLDDVGQTGLFSSLEQFNCKRQTSHHVGPFSEANIMNLLKHVCTIRIG